MGEATVVKKLLIGGLAGGGITIGAGIVSGQIGGAGLGCCYDYHQKKKTEVTLL